MIEKISESDGLLNDLFKTHTHTHTQHEYYHHEFFEFFQVKKFTLSLFLYVLKF